MNGSAPACWRSCPPAGIVLTGTSHQLGHGLGDLGTGCGLRLDAIGELFSLEAGGLEVLPTS